MGRFRFRMQNILGIKEKIEEQEKQAFAMAASKLAEEEELLELCKQKKAELEEKARELRRKKIDVLKLKESEALLKYQDEVIKAQLVKVRAAQKNLETQRIKMQKAVQERKAYDILRDKAFEEFMKED